MARLGMNAHLVTKIGDDPLASQILDELHRDSVCTDYVVQAPGQTSPFTYIIIDRQGASSPPQRHATPLSVWMRDAASAFRTQAAAHSQQPHPDGLQAEQEGLQQLPPAQSNTPRSRCLLSQPLHHVC